MFWPFDVVEMQGAAEKQVAHLAFEAAEVPTGSVSKLLSGDPQRRGGGKEPEGWAAVVCPSVRCNTRCNEKHTTITLLKKANISIPAKLEIDQSCSDSMAKIIKLTEKEQAKANDEADKTAKSLRQK